MAPERLLGARIGRGLSLGSLEGLAFAMGTHRRLGAGEVAAKNKGEGTQMKSRREAWPGGAAESVVRGLAGRWAS